MCAEIVHIGLERSISIVFGERGVCNYDKGFVRICRQDTPVVPKLVRLARLMEEAIAREETRGELVVPALTAKGFL
jgi:hypothetical protein